MRFDAEGTFPVRITEAYLGESNFTDGELEVAIYVETMDGQRGDWWHGELSQRYGIGNSADKMQWELTLATLEKIGWQHGKNFNDDALKTLIGIETSATTRTSKDGRYHNVQYLGDSGFAPKKANEADAAAKLAAIFGAPAPAQTPAPTAPVNANPFA